MKLRGLGCQGGVSVFTLKKPILIIFKKYSNSEYSQLLFSFLRFYLSFVPQVKAGAPFLP